jgi:hypothetical protein
MTSKSGPSSAAETSAGVRTAATVARACPARFSHDELGGVKCRWKRRCRSSHLWVSGVLWVA